MDPARSTEVVEALEAVKANGYLLQATCLESLRQELQELQPANRRTPQQACKNACKRYHNTLI